ncbi:10190_t:CDS:2 [Ambispora leptoticha]|uniref:10190_t:CDS:1 n=1 Tax=Ambispora leptoticha TaxID=144679 RepID=A0A9N9BAX7_9GLOM|nr:10190_t:CDS:2 [Ambispora leptoticha]
MYDPAGPGPTYDNFQSEVLILAQRRISSDCTQICSISFDDIKVLEDLRELNREHEKYAVFVEYNRMILPQFQELKSLMKLW